MPVHASSVLPSSICPSVWAIGDHAFQSQHQAQWQTLHNGWWFYYHSTTSRGTLLLLLTKAPACSHPLMVSHVHVMAYKHTQQKRHSFFWLPSICHIQVPTHNLNLWHTVCKINKQPVYPCTHANGSTRTHTPKHTHIHTFRHAHLPMCSLTLTWVGFPAVQAVSSINMCLLAGDPYVCITGR